MSNKLIHFENVPEYVERRNMLAASGALDSDIGGGFKIDDILNDGQNKDKFYQNLQSQIYKFINILNFNPIVKVNFRIDIPLNTSSGTESTAYITATVTDEIVRLFNNCPVVAVLPGTISDNQFKRVNYISYISTYDQYINGSNLLMSMKFKGEERPSKMDAVQFILLDFPSDPKLINNF